VTVELARLRLLLIGRAHATAPTAAPAKPDAPKKAARLTAAAYADALRRFAPSDATAADWRATVTTAVAALVGEGLFGADLALADRRAAEATLGAAFGAAFAAAPRWSRLVDHLVPARGLGVALDAKGQQRLGERDAMAAAIVGRALGLWSQGPPPSPAALCDQLAWQRLGLPGKAKRLPEELRALLLQRELATTPAPAARLLRLLAARELDVPRPDLRAWRDALGRRWLTGRELTAKAAAAAPTGATAPAAPTSPPRAPAPTAAPEAAPAAPAAPADFLDSLRRAVAGVGTDGAFGDRKVFIIAAWRALRAHPAWASLPLEAYKARLLDAHRAGALELARADLITAMDPALVAASVLESDGATFHFIVREGS
jgi:hypothetical protein